METLPILLQPLTDFLPDIDAATLWAATGEAFRTQGDSQTLADLETLTVPALRSLGIEAALRQLPESDVELQSLIQERLRHGMRVPLLQTALLTADTQTDAENSEETDTRQAAQIVGGKILDTVPDNSTELRDFGQFLLLLKRTQTKGGRLTNRNAFLLRLAAFASAYPQRLVTANPQDESRRRLCAAYFTHIAGKQRTRTHRQLRQIAANFASANVAEAFSILREIVIDNLDLPDTIHYALLETDRPLTPIERRELIYLARAGTLFLKILAVRRLHSEAQHPEVENTLRQLQHDLHQWVHDASRNMP